MFLNKDGLSMWVCAYYPIPAMAQVCSSKMKSPKVLS